MKHFLCPFAVFFALLALSCGEMGGGDSGNSSGSGDFSTSCGGKPYDASTSFCFEEKIYPFCSDDGDKKYNPDEQGCLNGVISQKCGEKLYDNTIKFCDGDSIYLKCNGEQYMPSIQFCFENTPKYKCRNFSISYNPEKEFCGEDDEIYQLCNFEEYDVIKQICFFNRKENKCIPSKYDDEYCDAAGISYRICGNIEYESAKKFCFNNEIYLRCGNDLKGYDPYDPYKEFCHFPDGSVYSRCGGNMYNPENYFCFDNKIYSMCGAEIYNPKELFCYENVLDTLCNGVEFNPKSSFCSHEDYKVYSRCNGEKYNTKLKICSKENSTEKLYDICPSGNFSNSLSNCCSVNPNNCTEYQLCGDAKEKYNIKTEFCDGKVVYSMCGGKPYDNPSNKFCWPNSAAANGQAIDKCQIKTGVDDYGRPTYSYLTYDYDKEFCSSDGIKDRNIPPTCPGINTATQFCCFGKTYNISDPYFCYNDEIYPKCGGETYDPNIKGCFDSKPYDKCSLPETKGHCVDNTLRRCKQLGSGLDHIVDPLPELSMTCQPNGAITGITKVGEYKVAQIGNQVWLAENLKENYTITESSSVCYDNVSANCSKYGMLYDWALGMSLPNYCNSDNCTPSNPCPVGFSLPSDDDWQTLVDYAGGAAIAGGRLKSTTGWSDNGNGTDSYGFNALPGGSYNEIFSGDGFNGTEGSISKWWSTTQKSNSDAYYWTIYSSDTEIRHFFQSKGSNKAYVRCLLYYK